MWLEEQGGSPMALLNSLAFLDTSPALKTFMAVVFYVKL